MDVEVVEGGSLVVSWVKSLTSREKWLIGAVLVIALIAAIAIWARPAGPGSELAQPAASTPAAANVAPNAAAPEAVGGTEANAAEAPKVQASDFHRRDANDPTALGDVDAPVVVVIYSDYRCPFCGLFANETQPALVEEYVNTGKVRLEWRDTPIFGDESINAAIAARAAGEQGLFWEYNAAVFARAESGQHTPLPRETLLAIAEEIGVPNLAAFETALDDPALRGAVQNDKAEATSIGANSTPSFIVGNQGFAGAQPLEVFTQVIDQELAAVGAR